MMDVCAHCGRGDVTLYAWYADIWCADCATKAAGGTLPLAGQFADAPTGRPETTTYDQPFVWQTPDESVQDGRPVG